MSFGCMLSTASEREGLMFNDRIPANAETWTALHALMRSIGIDPAEAEARMMKPRRVLEVQAGALFRARRVRRYHKSTDAAQTGGR